MADEYKTVEKHVTKDTVVNVQVPVNDARHFPGLSSMVYAQVQAAVRSYRDDIEDIEEDIQALLEMTQQLQKDVFYLLERCKREDKQR